MLKEQTIWDLMEIIWNDEKTTYEGIMNGQPYGLYLKQLLKTKYELMQYAKDNGIIDYFVEEEKEQDKEKYGNLIEEGK